MQETPAGAGGVPRHPSAPSAPTEPPAAPDSHADAPTEPSGAGSALPGTEPTVTETVQSAAQPPPPGAPGGSGGSAGQGGWGYSGADAPPPPPYGGGHGGQGGPMGPGSGGFPPPHDPWGMPPGPPEPRKKRRTGLLVAVVVTAIVAGGISGGVSFWAADRGANGDSTTITSSSNPKTLNRSPKSVAGIAAKALPSVVTIQSSGGGEEGTGTGFVYDKQGHILTNNHVVANGARGGKLTATFSDGKKYDAQVVGEAQGYDIAVLKLTNADDRKLDPLPLAKSGDVAVGDATIAIGAPFGLSGTVTTGIVSAKNRPVASSDGQGASASYMSALQTDASINPGNSGGPLLNAEGAVIGVNSAIQSGGGGGGEMGQGQSGSVGLGFAIPVNQAKRVATQLIKTGQPVYPVIGATVEMGGNGNGATISRTGESGTEPVTSGGPADKAGLKSGDIITKFDDTVIDSGPTLIGTIWTHSPGEKVKVTYQRDGKEHTVDVTLGSRKGDQ
ncbi:S1C family serine protease [Streptomyces iconiensis]